MTKPVKEMDYQGLVDKFFAQLLKIFRIIKILIKKNFNREIYLILSKNLRIFLNENKTIFTFNFHQADDSASCQFTRNQTKKIILILDRIVNGEEIDFEIEQDEKINTTKLFIGSRGRKIVFLFHNDTNYILKSDIKIALDVFKQTQEYEGLKNG